MIIVFSLYSIILTYPYLLFLQENHYHLNSYILIIKKELKKIENLLLFAPALLLIKQSILINLIIIILLTLYLLIRILKKTILKLKVTKRIIRFFCVITFINIILAYYLQNKYYLIIYLPLYVVLLSHLLLLPIEKVINKCYHLKAKKKINKVNPLVIGITGSYGKTTCKVYLYQLLKSTFRTYKTPKSYNTANSIAMSIKNMPNYTEVFIVEFGASKLNDIKESLKIVKPNISLITAIGNQHLETFKTFENIIKEKTRIIKDSKVHFYNINKNYEVNIKSFSYAINEKADFYIDNIKKENGKTKFTFHESDKEVEFTTNINGNANLENLCACLAISRFLHVKYKKLLQQVKNLIGEKNRLEIIKKGNVTIINDSFNSNKVGFVEALNILKTYSEEKILITPGVVTGGKEMRKNNIELAKIIAKMDIKVILEESIVSKIYEQEFKKANKKYLITKSFKKAYELALLNNNKKVILIENDITDIYK